jgi:hypothetical protein
MYDMRTALSFFTSPTRGLLLEIEDGGDGNEADDLTVLVDDGRHLASGTPHAASPQVIGAVTAEGSKRQTAPAGEHVARDVMSVSSELLAESCALSVEV